MNSRPISIREEEHREGVAAQESIPSSCESCSALYEPRPERPDTAVLTRHRRESAKAARRSTSRDIGTASSNGAELRLVASCELRVTRAARCSTNPRQDERHSCTCCRDGSTDRENCSVLYEPRHVVDRVARYGGLVVASRKSAQVARNSTNRDESTCWSRVETR